MNIGYILPMSIVMGIISYSLMAKWYVMPWARQQPLREALTSLLFLHTFRYIGMAFIIEGVTAQALDVRFADPAAYGDLLAAVLALLAIVALRQNWHLAIPLVWIFNIVGAVDLLNALTKGIMYTTDGHMGATYFIPAMIVPALLVTHVMIFQLLLIKREVHNV